MSHFNFPNPPTAILLEWLLSRRGSFPPIFFFFSSGLSWNLLCPFSSSAPASLFCLSSTHPGLIFYSQLSVFFRSEIWVSSLWLSSWFFCSFVLQLGFYIFYFTGFLTYSLFQQFFLFSLFFSFSFFCFVLASLSRRRVLSAFNRSTLFFVSSLELNAL